MIKTQQQLVEEQTVLDTIRLALEDIRQLLPQSMQDQNSIVGWIFSMIFKAFDFFKRMVEHFMRPPVNLEKTFSKEELSQPGAQDFLYEVSRSDLSTENKAILLDKWRACPEDKNTAWLAFAEMLLQMGNHGLELAAHIIKKQLESIKTSCQDQNSLEYHVDPALAKAFEDEVHLIQKAELQQIQEEARLHSDLLDDKRNNDLQHQQQHEQLLAEAKEKRVRILDVGAKVITHHYNMYKSNDFGLLNILGEQQLNPREQLQNEFKALNDKWRISV